MRKLMTARAGKTIVILAALLAGAVAVMAQEPAPAAAPEKPKDEGWKSTAELGYVVTGGNSSTSTFSLADTSTRKWAKDSLTFKAFILRSNATTLTRTAQGTETDYVLTVIKDRKLVAENYFLSALYDRRLAEKVVAQFGLAWDRNRFAGVASRVIFTAGTGYAWVETKKTVFKTDAGLTYNWRKYFGQSAQSFAGFRAAASFDQKFSDRSAFSSLFIFDDNLKRTSDWRYDWTNSISASISKSLALKTSLRMLYAHVPANENVPLFDAGGAPTGLTVPVPLKNRDTYFTTSLVINF